MAEIIQFPNGENKGEAGTQFADSMNSGLDDMELAFIDSLDPEQLASFGEIIAKSSVEYATLLKHYQDLAIEYTKLDEENQKLLKANKSLSNKSYKLMKELGKINQKDPKNG